VIERGADLEAELYSSVHEDAARLARGVGSKAPAADREDVGSQRPTPSA
jgi:hypothetical protein